MDQFVLEMISVLKKHLKEEVVRNTIRDMKKLEEELNDLSKLIDVSFPDPEEENAVFVGDLTEEAQKIIADRFGIPVSLLHEEYKEKPIAKLLTD